MKRILTIASAFAIALGGAAAATAEKPADPGRDHGLCTALFNGQKNGHEKQDQYPGPFGDLIANTLDADGDGSVLDDLYEACQAFGIGGNEEHGRFLCTLGAEDDPATPDDETDYACSEREGPGNS